MKLAITLRKTLKGNYRKFSTNKHKDISSSTLCVKLPPVFRTFINILCNIFYIMFIEI